MFHVKLLVSPNLWLLALSCYVDSESEALQKEPESPELLSVFLGFAGNTRQRRVSARKKMERGKEEEQSGIDRLISEIPVEKLVPYVNNARKHSEEQVAQMKLFGEKVGMAFQIKDDLFDYGTDEIGKPLGIDIKEKKMTLPLIYTLNKVDSKERRGIINTIKNHNTDKAKVKALIAQVKSEGGLDFAIQKMEAYKKKALALLEEFPKNEYRSALALMLNYVTDRKI